MRNKIQFLLLFAATMLTMTTAVEAQDFDAMFTSTSEETTNATGYSWAEMTGDTLTINAHNRTFRYPIAKFTSGKEGVIAVKKAQDFLYFNPSVIQDGVFKPVAVVDGAPVVLTHTGKYCRLLVSSRTGDLWCQYP